MLYGTRLRRSESQLPQKRICQAAHSGNGLGCADDNGPDTQEPDEVKACPEPAKGLMSGSEAAVGVATSPPTVTWAAFSLEGI